MRGYQKAAAAVVAAGLAASLAACSSSGGGDTPVGKFETLSGDSTSVVLDAGFVKALGALKLTPGLIGTAKMANGTVSFPITGGKATIYKKGDVTPYVQGVIDHNGSGLSLTGGPAKVDLKNFVVHPGDNSNLTGEVDVVSAGKTTVAAKSMKLFDLDGSTLRTPTISKSGVATLQGTTVYLSADAAKALNGVFKTTALAGGMKVKVGTAIIKATGS
jgi:hypothetical protein